MFTMTLSPSEVEAAEPEEFSGKIRVASRVIDYLSSGIYQNPAACLKELINNSYDADATQVIVSVKPEADIISIEDNGHGMSREDFVRHFENVAESHKRDNGEYTEGMRLKIGKIGIGFIAANELCDQMEIYSTRKGSRELLHVTIDFGDIRERPFLERREEDGVSIDKGDYDGSVSTDAAVDEQYTKVYLKDLRPAAIDEFTKSTDSADNEAKSLYGLKPESVAALLARLESWDELDRYSLTRLRVGLNVPVRYLPGWYPQEYRDRLGPIEDDAAALNFSVRYDGTELFKPTILPPSETGQLLHVVNFTGEHIKVSGYFYIRHGALKPKDMNGVLLRTRGAAVGEYDRSWMGFPKQINPLFQNWATSELNVEAVNPNGQGGLDAALNIDRRTLRDTHPAYVELQKWFIRTLTDVLNLGKATLYATPAKERRQESARQTIRRVEDLARSVTESYGPVTADLIRNSLGVSPASTGEVVPPRTTRALLREHQAIEVYEIAVECARAVLPDDLAEKFLQELIKRLS
jgi:hypothetical protein